MSLSSVVLFHNMVAPYRHALFREIARHLPLRVLYATRVTADRKWAADIPSDYESEVLRSATVYAFSRPLTVCANLPERLQRLQPQAIISVLTRSNAIDVLRVSRWANRHRVPLILWVGDIDNESWGHDEVPGLLSRAFAWLYGRILRRASGFICYSDRSVDWLRARGVQGPTITGTQVFDPPPLGPRVCEEEQGGRFRLLFVGKHEARKGLENLMQALHRLPNALQQQLSLTTAGDGPLARHLADNCPPPIQLRMLGFLPRNAISEEYRRADALIVPSLHDPWANVINEAMALGTPVIASRQCGGCELARTTGWIVDASDPQSIADGIERAMAEARSASLRHSTLQAEALYRPADAAKRIARFVETLCMPVDAPAGAAA
ncbi:glycosyltransferase [Povalibacter sp.]|uniref:glycosyltransferase family 4 protein n=1 Tax=Povalibacter sp. TaxID=1962978 RepID=UPI002F4180B0